jgi:hypothetical protein
MGSGISTIDCAQRRMVISGQEKDKRAYSLLEWL